MTHQTWIPLSSLQDRLVEKNTITTTTTTATTLTTITNITTITTTTTTTNNNDDDDDIDSNDNTIIVYQRWSLIPAEPLLRGPQWQR